MNTNEKQSKCIPLVILFMTNIPFRSIERPESLIEKVNSVYYYSIHYEMKIYKTRVGHLMKSVVNYSIQKLGPKRAMHMGGIENTPFELQTNY